MDLSGTIVPMATPVEDGQHVDGPALEAFTRSLVDAGVHGLFPASSVGEFPSLTTDQNRTVVETVAETADPETTVLAGCCATSVPDVVAHTRVAADVGADAAVVVTPYYLSTTQSGLVRFFEAVADESPLPVVLYNIPALTGNALRVETVRTLAEHPAIVGLKDTSGNLTYQHEVLSTTPPEFTVLHGATDTANASLTVGSDGLIAGPANVFPGALAELYDAHARADDATANRITRNVVVPIVTAWADLPTAAAVKYLAGKRGLDLGGTLPPLAPLTETERTHLDDSYRTVLETGDPSIGDLK